VEEVAVPTLAPGRFDPVIGSSRARVFAGALASARKELDGRTFWHVNSTATGGGVAEILQSVLGYLRGAEISTRWLTIGGDDVFFTVTKRLHHMMHGKPGDGGELGAEERAVYEKVLDPEAESLRRLIGPGDVVVLHDPQTLGLAKAVKEAGAGVIWTCHVGTDAPNERSRQAWAFLRPYLHGTDRQVFSRAAYPWEGLDDAEVAVIPPCIDAFSPKNQDLSEEEVSAILDISAVIPGAGATGAAASFVREDGRMARVRSRAIMYELGPVPVDAPVVTEVSRWDRLKDHRGVMDGFVEYVRHTESHLILAGPAPAGVSDDPESADVLEELVGSWRSLPDGAKRRVHIACLPMDDVEQNAAMVNALQRRADVVIQKSLAEGFGLTVAEAMWKRRAVVGSRVGGIQDQIDDGVSGRLLDDPADLSSMGVIVGQLLDDPESRRRMGDAARQRVVDEYLAPRFLTRYLELASSLR